MEEIFIYYSTFAVSGALVTWWCIFRPSLNLLGYETEGMHPILQSKFLSGIVWIGLATIAIPILIFPILSDKLRLNFIISLTQGFLHKK
jgi:hypothetical protein